MNLPHIADIVANTAPETASPEEIRILGLVATTAYGSVEAALEARYEELRVLGGDYVILAVRDELDRIVQALKEARKV